MTTKTHSRTNHWIGRSAFAMAALALGGPAIAEVAKPSPLHKYVAAKDASYGYEIQGKRPVGLCQAYLARLTSQKWRGIEWKHWLSVLVPNELEESDQMILFITGGNNGDDPPNPTGEEALIISSMAQQVKVPVGILQQVPNQPLFDNLREDDLIAHTYDKFLTGQGDDWPLLLPMAKSAVKAMDALEEIVSDKLDRDVKKFIVAGASKRGWTTWLTAAADDRVSAIAPMVIDVLNMKPQMRQQLETYGKFSDQIEPYTKRKIQRRMDTPEGNRLRSMVDPFTYRAKLKMPKLLLLGTNDKYWTADAARLYFPELEGEKHIHYVPNAGHGLGPSAIPAGVAFFRSVLKDKCLPEMGWERRGDGSMAVKWGGTGSASLWKATSPNRDFREATWASSALPGEMSCEVKLNPPAEGWLGYFVSVEFAPVEKGGQPYSLCTEITVTPDRFPHKMEEVLRRSGL